MNNLAVFPKLSCQINNASYDMLFLCLTFFGALVLGTLVEAWLNFLARGG